MISECVYDVLHVVPDYISSFDARTYAFPELHAVRKFNKKISTRYCSFRYEYA